MKVKFVFLATYLLEPREENMEILLIFGLIMAIENLIKHMILALFNFVGGSILAKYIIIISAWW